MNEDADNNSNDLRLSMYGVLDEKPISPSNVSLLDLKQMADDFGKFIRGSDDINLKELSVSVQEGCVSLSLNNYVHTPSMQHDYSILMDNPSGGAAIDPARATVISNLQAISKGSSDRKYVISYAGRKLTIDSSTDYKVNEPVYVDIEDYIYGELYDMGGQQIPNIHLVAEDGKKITVPAEKELLMNAGDRLYRKQLIYVSAKEDIKTGERKDYSLISFENYSPKWDEEEFDALVDFYTPKISVMPNAGSVIAAMRGYV
jgi:hypothetical protein